MAKYAVFTTGGKQYLVGTGDSIKIEKLLGEHKEGDKLVFDKVLLRDDTVGMPFITGSTVGATIKKIGRYPTVEVIKYKQKSRYYKMYGHRQPYFEIKIDSIS